MCNDSDQESSDLDIGSRSWSKLEKNMKLFGFREGAAKGREQSLQQGFDLGYLDGLKLGECLGVLRGVLSCQKELGIPPEGQILNDDLDNLSTQVCVICSGDKTEENDSRDIVQVISAQQTQNNEIINGIDKTNFKSYFEKR